MTATPETSAADAASGEPKESSRSAKSKAAKTGGAAHELIELGKTVFYALLIAFVLRVVLFQPFTIPSESMEPALLKGDYIIVSKFAYGWSRHSIPLSPPVGHGRLLGQQPHRGDIIVFKLPRDDGKTDYIKRLVGLPGDRVQVAHGTVFINGKAIPRQATEPGFDQTAFGPPFQVARFRETLASGKSYVVNSYDLNGPADNTGVYVVPPRCYFMMGDNRDNSDDSRFDPGDIPAGASACAWNRDTDRFVSSISGSASCPSTTWRAARTSSCSPGSRAFRC